MSGRKGKESCSLKCRNEKTFEDLNCKDGEKLSRVGATTVS